MQRDELRPTAKHHPGGDRREGRPSGGVPEERGYDEQWLLVVGSAGDGGTLDISDAEGEFTSLFDRTFFLETFQDECVELMTLRP